MDYLPFNNTEKYEIPLNEGIPSVTIFGNCGGPSDKNCSYNDPDLFWFAYVLKNETQGGKNKVLGLDYCSNVLPQ